MKHPVTKETMDDQEDRSFGVPPRPPTLCPSCDRESCLLWRVERRRLLLVRANIKAITFGLWYG
jgi:hypothetical protein